MKKILIVIMTVVAIVLVFNGPGIFYQEPQHHHPIGYNDQFEPVKNDGYKLRKAEAGGGWLQYALDPQGKFKTDNTFSEHPERFELEACVYNLDLTIDEYHYLFFDEELGFLIGQAGSMRYLLDIDGHRISKGYHDYYFDPQLNCLIGETGAMKYILGQKFGHIVRLSEGYHRFFLKDNILYGQTGGSPPEVVMSSKWLLGQPASGITTVSQKKFLDPS